MLDVCSGAGAPVRRALNEAVLERSEPGHTVHVREVRLSAGAGFVVLVCGDVMTMPGLPAHPAAETIDLDDAGQVTGLF